MEELSALLSMIFYGTVQGLTEVFPISSSGHLSLFGPFLPLPHVSLAMSAVLHVGSLVAIAWWFRRDIILLFRRFWASVGVIYHNYSNRDNNKIQLTEYQKIPFYILVSLLPTAVLGLILRPAAEGIFNDRGWASFFLILNGLILVFTARNTHSERTLDELDWKDFLIIGIVQGVAVIPGISRLGITICACLWRGLGWYDSMRLSFLLSIPAILGGFMVQMPEAARTPIDENIWPVLILGSIFALIFGLIGIRFFSRTLLEKKSLFPLGFYCCMLGLFSFLYFYLW